jgi:hypothetical protein
LKAASRLVTGCTTVCSVFTNFFDGIGLRYRNLNE